MPATNLLLATSNAGKAREMQAALSNLGVQVTCLSDEQSAQSPVEDADTFIGNARIKALYYASQCDDWTLADDSGLEVDALQGAPGVQSARFAGEGASDHDNNEKLLRALSDTPRTSRTGRFVCALVLARRDRILAEVEGSVSGMILTQACGENGFGYDPLFYVPSLRMTTAQMTREQKNEISHRGQAVSAMKVKMITLLNR